ncbi:hypothetical protein EV368DRAFT_66589 [Lentinula lateritia]|nr:hypothetical protein EV368DRAFT_66589 [Lentinula lateritia]
MTIRSLQVLVEASSPVDSDELYNAFEEAVPFLTYIHDFWIGHANCPLFAELILLTANSLSQSLPTFLRDNLEQQWGIPPDHQSLPLGSWDFKRFPAIPIPFCLWFREGSAMMCLVPAKDLESFILLHLSTTGPRPLLEASPATSPVEDSPPPLGGHQSVGPPKQNKCKHELASLMADASIILNHRSNIKTPLKEDPLEFSKAFASKKKVVEKPPPRPKATAQSKTTVKVEEESRVSPELEEPDIPSYQIKCVQLPPHNHQTAKGKARQVEVVDVDESETEEEVIPVIPPPLKWLKSSKFAPAFSKASSFRPALLIDDQGHLKLPGDLNSAPLQRQNPIFAINPDLQFQLKLVFRLCLEESSIKTLHGCQGLNMWTWPWTLSTCFMLPPQAAPLELCAQLDSLGALFDPAREPFLRSLLDLQQAGQDPIVVLEALKAAKPQCETISLEDRTLLATLFQWSSPFNLNGLTFDNRTPAEWIDLLRSTHSGTSLVEITSDGHLVDTSQPPEPTVEVSEALDAQGSPPITHIEKDSAVEDTTSLPEESPIQMEFDLPPIESLAKPTPFS